MALWIMGFGGTVGLGNLVAGSVIDATSVTTVLLVNACVAVLLAWYADLRTPPDALPLAIAPPDGALSRSRSRASRTRRSGSARAPAASPRRTAGTR